MSMTNRIHNEDTGASAILVAASLVLLMGFAALSIDTGNAFSDRRQQQSAADFAALAASQFARNPFANLNANQQARCNGLAGINLAACAGASEAIDVVNENLGDRWPQTGPGDAWDTCQDLSPPPEFLPANGATISSLSPCIRFAGTPDGDRSFEKVRVVLPVTQVDTYFGGIIGRPTVNVSAVAEAELVLRETGDVLPFAMGPTGAGSNQACLYAQSTSNLDIEPCDGPVEGNFGFLDVAKYKDPQTCNNASFLSKFAYNIILGADHPIDEWGALDPVVNDFANCPIDTQSVNELFTQSGNATGNAVTGGMEGGFFHGHGGLDGRLICDAASADCEAVYGGYPAALDDTPLWEFLNAGPNEHYGRCNGPILTRQEMQDCLAGWRQWNDDINPLVNNHTYALFDDSIADNPRFGAVPQLEDDPSSGVGWYLVLDFRPVYIETILVGCSANTCDFVFSPGEDSSGACPGTLTPTDTSCGWPNASPGLKQIDAATAFVLRDDMLPASIIDDFPASEGRLTYSLIK